MHVRLCTSQMNPTIQKMVPRWCLLLLLSIAVGVATQPAVAQRSMPRPQQQFASGVQLYEQQLYPDAAEALSAFRTAHPSHLLAPQSLYLEARAALAENRSEDTRRLLSRLQREFPDHPRAQEARLGLAQYYLDEGALDQATSELEVIANDPQSPSEGARALYLLGRTAQQQNRHEAALSYFDRVRAEYPEASTAPAALYARGVTQVQMERFDAATASFEALGDEYPNSGFAENLGTVLGEVYYRLDRYEDAAAELQRRLPQLEGEERARALFLLGESYNQMQESEMAVSQYQNVLENHPESSYAPAARYGLAWHFLRAERYDEAASAFSQVRGTNSNLAAPATYYEAAARALDGSREDALQLYRTYLDMNPDGELAEEAQYERGLLLYQQERYDQAATAFEAVAQSGESERTGEAYYWLGNARLANQQMDRALEAYNEARERDAAPPSVLVEVRFQDAWNLYQNERYGEAASEFRALANEYPDTARGQEALLWAADARYQQENYARAGSLFQQYLQTDPEGPQRAGALYGLAWTRFKQRQFQPAARRFRAFLNTYDGVDTDIPYRRDARMRLADSYFALKQYDEAIAAYERTGGSGSDYALYQAGKAHYFAGQTQEALERLNEFANSYPESPWQPDALYRIADLHFQQQQYEAAREAYRRLIDEHPNHQLAPEAQYAIGDSYYNAGEMDAAVEAYREVLESYPESEAASEAASSLFFALDAAGQQDRAPELIESIAENSTDPTLADRLQFQRARAAYQSGQSKRALRLFRDFVRTTSVESLVPSSYYHLGLLYADLDQDTEAQNYLRQLVEQYPNSDVFADGALRLGDIYADNEQYAEAAEAYQSAAEAEGEGDELLAQALYGQAMALLQLNQPDEAESLLQQLIEEGNQGPLLASARLGMARIREQQGRTEDALSLYRDVVESVDSETGAEALYRLGHLLREEDRYRQAIQELDRMPSLFAGYPEWEARALLEQARTYRSLGETGQATQLYDEVLDQFAGTPFAETAREERESISSAS